MNARIILMMFFIVTSSSFCNAQEMTRELGITFQDLDNFGITYKFGKADALWRLRTVAIAGANQSSQSDNNESDYSSYGVSAGFGREFRKNLLDNLQFRYGLDAIFQYTRSESETSTTNYSNGTTSSTSTTRDTFSPGINLVAGLNLVLKEKIIIGLEILPGFYYTSGDQEDDSKFDNGFEYWETHSDSDFSGYNFNASLSSATLSLAYRFVK